MPGIVILDKVMCVCTYEVMFSLCPYSCPQGVNDGSLLWFTFPGGGSPGKSRPRSRNAPGFLTLEMTFVNCGLRLWSVFSESRTYLPAQVDLPHLCCEKPYVLRIHSLYFSDLGKAFHDETDVSHCHLSDTEPQTVIDGETGLGDAVIHASNYRVREAEAQVGKCLGRGCKIAWGKVQMRTKQSLSCSPERLLLRLVTEAPLPLQARLVGTRGKGAQLTACQQASFCSQMSLECCEIKRP